ncbi:hypothetical protein AX16_003733 [Volvariella volvacea WC 439]|nr:hypothetical protein AX16_003733 [Volvariella volvacea WC 439]
MPPFRPARTSSPLNAASTSMHDLSSSFAQLANLGPQEIRVIDSVIQRAGPSTNALSAVYQAYTETIKTLDLDPKEVAYYDLLLSLWKVKGRNWGDKWDAVMQHFGYQLEPTATQYAVPTATRQAQSSAFERVRALPKFSRQHEPDSETEDVLTDDGTGTESRLPQYHSTPRLLAKPKPRPLSPASSIMTHESTDIAALPMLAAPPKRQTLNRRWHDTRSEGTEEPIPSSTPPSYRAAIGVSPMPIQEVPKSSRLIFNAEQYLKEKKARSSLGTASNSEGKRRSSVIDVEDTWEKIRRQRDEEFAEERYKQNLCRRFLWMWSDKYTLICDELEHASAGRDCIILEVAYRRWQANTIRRIEAMKAYAEMSDKHTLIRHFSIWRKKYKEKKQNAWREDMRRRMKVIQDRRNRHLLIRMWKKWYQLHLAELLRQRSSEKQLVQYVDHWYNRLLRLREMEIQADTFIAFNLQQRYWIRLKKEVYARYFSRQIDVRIMSDAMTVWQKRLQRLRAADAYHNASLQRLAFSSWKRVFGRLKELKKREQRHRYTQNAILIRAVWRVWTVRAHAPTNEKILAIKLLQRYFHKWQNILSQYRQSEEIAIAFAERPQSALVVSSFKKWSNMLTTHRNAHAYASEHYLRQLRIRVWVKWQDAIVARQHAWHSARRVHEDIQLRLAWQKWRRRWTAKKQQAMLEQLQRKKAATYYLAWRKRFLHARECKLIGKEVEQQRAQRILHAAISKWKARIVVIQHSRAEAARVYDIELLRRYFDRWRALSIKHQKNKRLLDTYLSIQRKETMRRVFRLWINAARASVNKKQLLREREHEFKVRIVSKAWGQWRARYFDEMLRPLEVQVTQQTQRNLLFRAFGIWYGNTKATIHIYSTKLKAKAFDRWRQAIAPFEDTKKAREMCRQKLLSTFSPLRSDSPPKQYPAKYLAKWLQAHRTRLAHKALARARYLRVAPSISRQSALVSTTVPPVSDTSEESQDESTTTTENDDESAQTPMMFNNRRSLAEVFLSKGRRDREIPSAGSASSPVSRTPTIATSFVTARSPTIAGSRAPLVSRPTARAVDAESTADSEATHRARTRSVASEQPVGRRRLWKEYQISRARSRPPSEYSSRP